MKPMQGGSVGARIRIVSLFREKNSNAAPFKQ
jgi:hypothetical protein